MSFSVRNLAPNLALNAVVNGLTCYALHQIEPVLNVNYLITVGIVHSFVTIILRNLVSQIAYALAKKYGYINEQGKPTTDKFFHLGNILLAATNILMTIFYQSVGKTMGYQTPSFIHTYGYLSLSFTSAFMTINVLNFVSWHSKGGPVIVN